MSGEIVMYRFIHRGYLPRGYALFEGDKIMDLNCNDDIRNAIENNKIDLRNVSSFETKKGTITVKKYDSIGRHEVKIHQNKNK